MFQNINIVPLLSKAEFDADIEYNKFLLKRIKHTYIESEQKLLGSIQVAQNKLARFLNGNKLMDKIPTSQIFKDLNLQSVNQINAQIKLLDVWKSLQSEYHPMKWARRNENNLEQRTRAAKTNNLCEAHGGKILSSTFMNDAAKLWNIAPESIKNCVTVSSVKKQIKLFTATLPI